MELFGGNACKCGKRHVCSVRKVLIEQNALDKLPSLLKEAGAVKPFLIMDRNTEKAAGEKVRSILSSASMAFSEYVFESSDPIPPTEENVGKAAVAWDPECDFILAIGSGVINDIGKLICRISGRPYILVLTAPSMDGMVSATSSMDVNGLKVSLPSAVTYAVVGDLDVLSAAPAHMVLSGFGDMLAKYVSTLEWLISNRINGEYYCSELDNIMQESLKKVSEAAPFLLRKDKKAIKDETEGLIFAGCAMTYAGVSRPASGMEHYFSHIIDMRHLAFGTPSDLHGIQVGIATLASLKIYEMLEGIDAIDVDKALKYVDAFDTEAWLARMKGFVGPAGDSMIELERKEGKYDKAAHKERLKRIASLWPELRALMLERLPSSRAIEDLMKSLGMPTTFEEIGVEQKDIPLIIKCSKDIRDKYVGTRLLWDIGLLDEVAERIALRI